MNQFANVGDFCPNEVCPRYGQLREKQPMETLKRRDLLLVVYNAVNASRSKTFTVTKGTKFYSRRTSTTEILEMLAFSKTIKIHQASASLEEAYHN